MEFVRVAIASEGNEVSPHFGHCQGFTIYDLLKDGTHKRGFLKNPGHTPGFLPNYLGDLGVNVVIAGGIGASAIEIFKGKNIEVITGISGDVEDVIKQYADGLLESSGDVCDRHEHAGSCEGH